jgi:hypothetical protein
MASNIYDAAKVSPPHASDRPDAVRGPWVAVRYTPDGYAIPVAEPYYGDPEDITVSVVRGTRLPVDDGDGSRRMPGTCRAADGLYEVTDFGDDDDLENCWAQARMVAALLNHNQDKLDALAAAQNPSATRLL